MDSPPTAVALAEDVRDLAGRVENNEDQIESLGRWRVSVDGLRGENGKIGALRGEIGVLRRDLDAERRRLSSWQKAVIGIAATAIGALGGAIKAIDMRAEERGVLKAQLETCRRDIAEQRADNVELRAEMRALMAAIARPPGAP
jgi:hypothetical protein